MIQTSLTKYYESTFQPSPDLDFVKSRRILIIEDDKILSRIIQAVLEKHGFSTEIAEDGQRALETIWENRQPSAILLDLTLPHHNGFEILDIIRGIPFWQEIPVLILSATKDAKDAVRAFKGGANDFITKPVRFSELVEKVDIFSL